MSVFSGPNNSTNGLVFEYDMNNTKKSWLGAPAINTCAYSVYNWTDGNCVVTRGVTPPIPPPVTGFEVCKIQANPGVATSLDILYTSSVDQVNGGVYTHSAWILLTSGTYAQIGQHWNPWDSGPAQYIPVNVWTRIQYTVTNSTNNYGSIANAFGTDGTIYVTGVQYEKGSFATPFINTLNPSGTRSNTQALFDLTNTNTNTVTTTELTYESNGNFKFDGVNDYLTISTFTNKPTTAITCESWIKPTKPSVGTGTIRGAAISATNSMYLGIIDSTDGGNTFSLHWANQTSNSRLYSWTGNIPNNAWSHLVGTYDGTTSRAYLNGVEIWSTSQTGTIPDATYVLGTYGLGLQDGVHNLNGYLDVANIYNRALSAQEVKQNFNALRGRYGI